MPKRHVKLFFSLALLFLVVGQVHAGGETIQLGEAVKLALEVSIDHRIAKLEWEQAQIAYQKAMADNLLAQSTYNQRLAELNLLKGETTYKKSIANTVITAVRRFTEVELAIRDVQIRGEQLMQSQKAYALALKKAETQNASEHDVLDAKAALAKSQAEFEKAQDTLVENQKAFFLVTGTDQYLPDGELPLAPLEVELGEALPIVLDSSVALKEANENLELARLDLERLLLDETAELLMREARNKVFLAELRLEQSQVSITQEVTAAYNAAYHGLRAYETACISRELQDKQYGVTQRQVAAGLKTEEDLTKAQIALWEADRSVYSSLANYTIALLQFDEVIGKDLSSSLQMMVQAADR